MASAPCLFDQSLVRQNLKRALTQGAADFLLAHVAEDFDIRLKALARSFSLVADIGTPGSAATSVLKQSGRATSVIRHLPVIALASNQDDRVLVGDTGLVPFAHESLDAAFSLLALHWVDDLPGFLAQIRKALKPDGLFMACLLGGQTLHELRTAFMQAESEIDGGVSPRVSPFADLRDLGALMQRAGFALPVIDTDVVTVRYSSPLALLKDLRAMGATNSLIERRKRPLRRQTLFHALDLYARYFSDADGRVRATFECLWISGWTPHASQQKPLKPGSASMRLADALTSKRIES